MSPKRPFFAAVVFAALAILWPMPAYAQRVGGSSGGSGAGVGGAGVGRAGVGAARGASVGAPQGKVAGSGARVGGRVGEGRGRHGEHNRGDVIVGPLWYDGWGGWYEEPYSYSQPEPPAQTIIMPPATPEPVRIAPDPKVVEVRAPANATAKAKLPPAIFILSNGQRIEAEQYLLTADRVQLTADRRSRTIPLRDVDLKATIAANREHGIDLHIPSDATEISLGF